MLCLTSSVRNVVLVYSKVSYLQNYTTHNKQHLKHTEGTILVLKIWFNNCNLIGSIFFKLLSKGKWYSSIAVTCSNWNRLFYWHMKQEKEVAEGMTLRFWQILLPIWANKKKSFNLQNIACSYDIIQIILEYPTWK